MEDFFSMEREDLKKLIYEKKQELGDKVLILAHNFTLDDLHEFADVIGDSSKLTNASIESKADFLLFTGASFFTEVACILVPEKKHIQANLQANCPLSYTIDENATRAAYNAIKSKCKKRDAMPMAYFTASYQLKSFCGEMNGTVCTASNAATLIEHYIDENKAIFFTPMNNVAFNVVKQLEIPDDEVFLLDENTDLDSIPGDKKIYIWDIGCYVHAAFTADDVMRVKNQYKDNDIKIVAHLECLPSVIEHCDHAMFTDGINELIKNSPPGSYWGTATVYNFGTRLIKKYPDKTIVPLRSDLICKDMVITDLPHVAESLQSIIDYSKGNGELKYELKVPLEYRVYAKQALETMFEINRAKQISTEVVNF